MASHYKGKPEEMLALDTYIKLTRATNSFENRVQARGSLGKLTLSQFAVLEALYHLGPLCQGELSQKLLKSTGNMTMVVDNLERGGFVRRVRSVEDRRMISIELTAAGTKEIECVLPLQVAAITVEMSVLTPAEQATLCELTRKLGRGKPVAAPAEQSDGIQPIDGILSSDSAIRN